jgi:cell shape-determining protein MreD
MNNRIFKSRGIGTKDRLRVFARWFFYSLMLLVFYMLMSGGFFHGWQPILIIPLAIAVAMRQRELSASVFGAVCGLVIDIASGRLFGFSAFWLLPGCLAVSLLVSHLIKVNILNFIWLNAAVCILMALADYFFRYILWNVGNSYFVLLDIIIPAHLSAVILSPLIYLAVKMIWVKLSPPEYTAAFLSETEDED